MGQPLAPGVPMKSPAGLYEEGSGCPAAAWRYVRELRAAVEALRQAMSAPGEPPPGVAVAAREVEEATRRHLTVLESLLGRVPEQAWPALQHALEAAKRGHEQANVALDRAAERAGTGGKPENTGRPGGNPGGLRTVLREARVG